MKSTATLCLVMLGLLVGGSAVILAWGYAGYPVP